MTRDDDSRSGNRLTSQRPTARDVPIAKFSDLPIGTSPPRGLRGPSLLPGQGAPEPIIPEEIELAVLRDADTLDGPRVARLSPRSGTERTSAPSPNPVSVEVPRARKSAPPDLEAMTPKSPSARSVQSGTLMSIGSVDPRAPTELNLPGPRRPPVSSERPYPVPEAVVDRSPAPLDAERREPMRIGQNHPDWSPYARPPEAPAPRAQRAPRSSGSGYSGADSPAPAARHFAREPESYPPRSDRHGQPPQSSSRPSARNSGAEAPPEYLIHAELEALQNEYDFADEGFDLRGISTQREPLAGRRLQSQPEPEPIPEPVSASQRGLIRLSGPSSSSAITLWSDRARARASGADFGHAHARDSVPHSESRSARATVPLSWVVGATFVGLTVALLLFVSLRGPVEASRGSAAPVAAAAPVAVALPSRPEAPVSESRAGNAPNATGVANVPPPAAHPAPLGSSVNPVATTLALPVRSPLASSSARSVEVIPSAARPSSAPAAAHGSSGSTPAELNPKSHQSIY